MARRNINSDIESKGLDPTRAHTRLHKGLLVSDEASPTNVEIENTPEQLITAPTIAAEEKSAETVDQQPKVEHKKQPFKKKELPMKQKITSAQ